MVAVATPQTTYAACNATFITFPAWYNGLTNDNCNIKSPESVGGLTTFILIIAMNIIETLMQAVVYIVVGFIIWGGFKYVTAYGESNEIVVARQRILNAVIGLIIAMLALGIVNFIGASLK